VVRDREQMFAMVIFEGSRWWANVEAGANVGGGTNVHYIRRIRDHIITSHNPVVASYIKLASKIV